MHNRLCPSTSRFLGKKIVYGLGLSLFLLFYLLNRPVWGSFNAEFLHAQGSQQYLAGNYAQARETLAQAAHLAPEDAAIHLALGQCYLALKDYKNAYGACRTALNLDPDIKQGRLYLGISQYFLKQYQRSFDTLNLARAQDPEDGLIRYYLALCAMQLDRPQQAQQEFAQGYRLSPEYAAHFQPYEKLALIPTDVRSKKFRQEFLLGMYYDSNADLHTDRFYLSIGRKGSSHVDWAGQLGSRTEFYPILKPNYNLGMRLNVFYNHFTWLDVWNFFNARAEAFCNVKAGPIVLQPIYAIDYTMYAGQEFSTFYTYGMTVGWPETDWLRGEMSYRARDKQFHYARGIEYLQHGWDHEVGFYQGLMLSKLGIVRLGVIYDRDLAEGVYEANRTIGGVLDGVIYLLWNVTWWSQFEVGYQEFDNQDAYSLKTRRNTIYRVQLLLKKPLWRDLSFWCGYGYTKVRCNIPEWQYDRSMVKFQLTWNLF